MKNIYRTAFVCLLIAIASGCGGRQTLKRDWETVFDESGDTHILFSENSNHYRVSFNYRGDVTFAILPFEGGQYYLINDEEMSRIYEVRPGQHIIRDKITGEILDEKKGTNWIIDASTSTIVPNTNVTSEIDLLPL